MAVVPKSVNLDVLYIDMLCDVTSHLVSLLLMQLT